MVGNISPSSPARLVPGTEVLVAPKSRNISSQTSNVSDSHSLRVLPMPEEEACYLQAESISEWDACPFLVFVHSETFTVSDGMLAVKCSLSSLQEVCQGLKDV